MEQNRTRRLAAVWFADIVGYTALSTRDENAALAVVDEFQRLSKESVGEKGRVVKFLGDGALSIFDSTSRALESAIALRDAFAVSDVARRHGCTLSFGVHVGEVVQAEDGDVYGDGVNVASRIEGVATTNQIIVSEDVYRLIHNRPEYDPRPIGEHMLKGVDKPASLYVLARRGETAASARRAVAAAATGSRGEHAGIERSHRRAVAIGTLAGVVGFVLLSLFVAGTVDLVEEPGEGAGTTLGSNPVDGVGAAGPAPGGDAVANGARAGGASGTATRDAPPGARGRGVTISRPPQTDTPADDAAGANRLLVMVFGEAPAGTAETQIVRALGSVSGVDAVDAPAAALLRRNPEAARAAMQGDFSALAELARRNGIEYLVLGDFESAATPLRADMFSGSAQLGLRMYRVSSGQLIESGTFTTGMGSEPGTPGRTEMGVRTQAAQAVGREGAVAARRWLIGSRRN